MELTALYRTIDQLAAGVKSRAADARKAERGERCDAATVEKEIFIGLLGIGRQLLAEYFKGVGAGNEGYRMERDGREYKRKTRTSMKVLSVFGEVDVSRWAYYAAGAAPIRPTEERANLPDRQASYFVQRLVARSSIRDTYEETVKWFEELFGISLSTHTGDEIVSEMARYHGEFEQAREAPEAASEGEIQVVSFDGKGVPVIRKSSRTEAERFQKRTKARDGRKRQAMVGLEYTVDRHLRTPEDVAYSLAANVLLTDEQRERLADRQPARNIHYCASIAEDTEAVMREIQQSVAKKGDQRPTACLIDGALHLWKLAEKIYPDAIKILDIIHVCQYLWEAANVLAQFDNVTPQAWVVAYLKAILDGRVGRVIGGLRQRLTRNKALKGERRRTIERVITYFDNHRQYMRYDRYLRQGLPIATGVVESACGHLVKDRMECAGARWSIPGAEAMLRLRAIYKNDDWDQYEQFRKRQERQRLYPTAAA